MASWVENNSSPLLFRSRPLIKIEPVFSYWATLANCPTVFSLFLTFAFVSWNKNQHERNKSTRRSLAMFFISILINLSQKHHRRWRQQCLHWQNLKQYKKNIKLWTFRCASIPGIHIGESVSQWFTDAFEILSTIAWYCFRFDHQCYKSPTTMTKLSKSFNIFNNHNVVKHCHHCQHCQHLMFEFSSRCVDRFF